MEKKSTAEPFGSRAMWASLEEMARQRIQGFVQELLEEEVTALIGRGRSERRPVVRGRWFTGTVTARLGGWR